GQWSRNQKNKFVTVEKKVRNESGQKVLKSYSDTILESANRFVLSLGTRAGYTTANSEFFVTPRATVSYYPRVYMEQNGRVVRRDVILRFSTGLYYQPPFYREFRTFNGNLNLNVKSQKSYH